MVAGAVATGSAPRTPRTKWSRVATARTGPVSTTPTPSRAPTGWVTSTARRDRGPQCFVRVSASSHPSHHLRCCSWLAVVGWKVRTGPGGTCGARAGDNAIEIESIAYERSQPLLREASASSGCREVMRLAGYCAPMTVVTRSHRPLRRLGSRPGRGCLQRQPGTSRKSRAGPRHACRPACPGARRSSSTEPCTG